MLYSQQHDDFSVYGCGQHLSLSSTIGSLSIGLHVGPRPLRIRVRRAIVVVRMEHKQGEEKYQQTQKKEQQTSKDDEPAHPAFPSSLLWLRTLIRYVSLEIDEAEWRMEYVRKQRSSRGEGGITENAHVIHLCMYHSLIPVSSCLLCRFMLVLLFILFIF